MNQFTKIEAKSESRSPLDLNTNGFCLLCLDILPMNGGDKCGKLLNISVILRNLKANLSENVSDDSQVKTESPSRLNLLEKVNRTAEFCEECAVIISKISERFQLLEKVEMELEYYLKMVRSVIVQTGDVRRERQDQFQERMSSRKETENIMRIRSLLSDKCKEMMTKRAQLILKVKKLKLESIHNQRTSSRENPKQPDFDPNNHCEPTEKFEPLPCSPVDDEDFANDYDGGSNSSMEGLPIPKTKLNKKVTIQIQKAISKTCKSPKDLKQKRHKCGQCQKSFCYNYHLIRHILAVHLRIRFKCPFPGCTKSYATKEKLGDHRQAAHTNSIWTCDICNEEFSYYRKMYEHRHRDLNLSEYRCHLCGKYFMKTETLRNHQAASHFNAGYACRLPGCSKMYTKKEHLDHHLQKVHPLWKEFSKAEKQNSSSSGKSAVGDGTEAEMSSIEVSRTPKEEV